MKLQLELCYVKASHVGVLKAIINYLTVHFLEGRITGQKCFYAVIMTETLLNGILVWTDECYPGNCSKFVWH